MGLVLLPVCHIHQPALPPAGVLLSLQEEEDPRKVGFSPQTCKKNKTKTNLQTYIIHIYIYILSFRYGDMRVMMGCEIFSMWQNLGECSRLWVSINPAKINNEIQT